MHYTHAQIHTSKTHRGTDISINVIFIYEIELHQINQNSTIHNVKCQNIY